VPQSAAPAKASTSGDGKIRHEWYQNETHVILTVFAKAVAEKDVALGDDSLMNAIKLPPLSL